MIIHENANCKKKLRSLSLPQVYVKPFPDPSDDGGGAGAAASMWTTGTDANGDKNVGKNGTAFTPTIRKATAQLYKVTQDPQIEQLPSNSGKKVGLIASKTVLSVGLFVSKSLDLSYRRSILNIDIIV